MEFIFTKKDCYDVPEGEYHAVLRKAFIMSDGNLRLVFTITSKTHPLLNYLAGKDYAPGSQKLAEDLVSWLGLRGLQKIIRENGTIDYEALIGREADLRIEPVQVDGYETPYAKIIKISPYGDLIALPREA